MKIRNLLCILSASFTLIACGSGPSESVSTIGIGDVNTNQTDALEIRADYTNKNFLADGIGVATLASCTDGDTTNFWIKTEGVAVSTKITIRYNVINTPESTGQIEPWGKQASNFVCNLLTDSYRIVLDNELDLFEKSDSNGRYLGFVWYQKTEISKLRMLNLELVELGYTKNLHYTPASKYFLAFEAGGKHALATGVGVNGQSDPLYVYDDKIWEVSISEIRNNYAKYGDDITTGTKLLVTGHVVGMVGDSMVIRDIAPDEDGNYAGMFVFAAYGTALASAVDVGHVVKFQCNAAKFLGNIQLSNINVKTAFEILTKEKLTQPTTEFPLLKFDPSIIDSQTATKQILSERVGDYVETEVTIRNIETGDLDENGEVIVGTERESYFREDAKGNITIYSKLRNGMVLNMRIDATMSPKVTETRFEVGKTYRVRALLNPYYENYQLQLFNNKAAYKFIELVE